MNLSQNRKKLESLISQMESLAEVFFNRKPLMKGSIYRTQTKCGSDNCRCTREGKLHEVWRLTRSHKGKTQTRTLKPQEVRKYKKYTQAYRRHRKARAELVKLNKKILKVADEIEKEKRKILKGIK